MVDDLVCISECGHENTQMNSYINYKTSSKKLQFGVGKCKKIHIGKNKNELICGDLFVDGWKADEVKDIKSGKSNRQDVFEGEKLLTVTDKEKYLGDIISSDGKNMKNIENRKNRGTGIVTEISAMIVEIMLDQEHFEVALIMRNALLISSLLCNSEAWYSITKSDIEKLEKVDEQLLRNILGTSSKTPKALIYLELGCVPISYILKSRRLNFLQYILKEDEESMIKKFYNEQLKNPNKDDWTETVKKNIIELKINKTMEELKKMSKNSFKKLVRKNTEEAALEFLKSKIKSKGKEIKYTDLNLQYYLRSNVKNITNDEKKNIFKLRSRMIKIKTNMGGNTEDFNCDACEYEGVVSEETQKHILLCPVLTKDNMRTEETPEYESIFTHNTVKMAEVSQRIYENLKTREKYTI